MQGLNKLKREKVLCDVTLIAEGERFEVHKIILVSCSDYFRSMFTSGMKECTQKEIELKGITSKGLEKVLEIIYTSTTYLEGDDIFDVIAAATHLQVTPVIEFCERNFLSGMTTSNYYDFINTARLYSMSSALRQIDTFICKNLLQISKDGTLHLLTYEQINACLNYGSLSLKEIDIFQVVWDWLKLDSAQDLHSIPLMKCIRHVQAVDIMMKHVELRDMVVWALNYHVVPHSQPIKANPSITTLRTYSERLVSIGGREIHPNPGLHDEIWAVNDDVINPSTLLNCRRRITTLPTPLSHMQVVAFNDFLYVIGGCTTQCAHGESAVNSVVRYDPRFNVWFQVANMINKRAYFYAGLLKNRIIAVGGKFKEGSLSAVELYDPERNVWVQGPSLPFCYHAHAGAVHKGRVYVSGGYSSNHFTPDLLRLDVFTGVWDELSPMSYPRGWHVMCVVRDRILVFGGCNLNANQHALPVMQSESYDPDIDQWTNITPLSVSHKEASCVLYRDKVYVLGGYNVQTKTGQKSVSRYDPYSAVWECVGSLSQSHTGVGYCVLKLPKFENHPLD
ncbi:hypothetical protein HELRODRAFT_186384 [Helobdella robusta]|uniref:BTB domain-containing protein n=1 Tax=Helobdella robusta TaxID=6412 RepID=T1FNZ0_HELRO|nr:hypothetical protein HELRODRAFT_186384 [Helobdella robusta]ESO06389.1 hypothetical protein HELRODRAFT_186384 [Helobdella robusta]